MRLIRSSSDRSEQVFSQNKPPALFIESYPEKLLTISTSGRSLCRILRPIFTSLSRIKKERISIVSPLRLNRCTYHYCHSLEFSNTFASILKNMESKSIRVVIIKTLNLYRKRDTLQAI